MRSKNRIKNKYIKTITFVLIFLLLTVLTQTGGVIFLLMIPLFRLIDRKAGSKLKRRILKPLSFAAVYLFSAFLLVPFIAGMFGRVPLPVFGGHLQPLTLWTCALNRHYVRPELKETLLRISEKMTEKYPGAVTAYLDASFPFFDGFPMLPHLSHNDGRKLDLAFFYTDSETGEQLNDAAPSWMGYGVFEEPRPGEQNMPEICAKKGYWQYSYPKYLAPQWNKDDYSFDSERTAALLSLLANEAYIGKIFIEPHLKQRMNLSSAKIRFHGCRAVRHDDHVHVQGR